MLAAVLITAPINIPRGERMQTGIVGTGNLRRSPGYVVLFFQKMLDFMIEIETRIQLAQASVAVHKPDGGERGNINVTALVGIPIRTGKILGPRQRFQGENFLEVFLFRVEADADDVEPAVVIFLIDVLHVGEFLDAITAARFPEMQHHDAAFHLREVDGGTVEGGSLEGDAFAEVILSDSSALLETISFARRRDFLGSCSWSATVTRNCQDCGLSGKALINSREPFSR